MDFFFLSSEQVVKNNEDLCSAGNPITDTYCRVLSTCLVATVSQLTQLPVEAKGDAMLAAICTWAI
jgi:hypothetical protein